MASLSSSEGSERPTATNRQFLRQQQSNATRTASLRERFITFPVVFGPNHGQRVQTTRGFAGAPIAGALVLIDYTTRLLITSTEDGNLSSKLVRIVAFLDTQSEEPDDLLS